jgi:hypothetical protein
LIILEIEQLQGKRCNPNLNRRVAKMATDGIMTMQEGSFSSVPGEWPSGKATDFESVYRGFESLLPSL